MKTRIVHPDVLELLADEPGWRSSTVSDEVFNVVFEAWRTCHRLLIDYRNSRDERSQRVIEPHAIVFYDMQWSIRAFCPDTKKWRTYLVLHQGACSYVFIGNLSTPDE